MATVTDITSIPLYQILGAPLLAMVQAETQAAQATAQFIQKIGFHSANDGDDPTEDNVGIGELRTVTFRYSKMGLDGEDDEFQVAIPVLAIIPIPAIQISEATINFAVEINAAVKLETNTPVSAPDVKGQDNSIESQIVGFKGGLARSDSKTAMKVEIKLKQADVPVGMQALFRLMEQGISSSNKPKPETPSSEDQSSSGTTARTRKKP